MEPERPKVDRAVLDFIKGTFLIRPILSLAPTMSAGLIRKWRAWAIELQERKPAFVRQCLYRIAFLAGGASGRSKAQQSLQSWVAATRPLLRRSLYYNTCAGIAPVANATAAAWGKFMQCNLWRAASRCVFTVPKAKPRISPIS